MKKSKKIIFSKTLLNIKINILHENGLQGFIQ
jgi:hypothetical protein